MEYLKFMKKGCVGPYSGRPLEPDVWLPEVEGDLVLCRNGYHLCKLEQAMNWLNEEAYSVEFKEPVLFVGDKICAASIRMTRIPAWNEIFPRLFAADCAERVLPIFEKQFPDDDRPAKAIEAVRLFANGEITKKQMDGARAALGIAWGAARAALGAAWGAAWDGGAASAAAWAASDAAWAAGAAAAAAAAGAGDAANATRAAERAWQSARLMQYIKGEAGR